MMCLSSDWLKAKNLRLVFSNGSFSSVPFEGAADKGSAEAVAGDCAAPLVGRGAAGAPVRSPSATTGGELIVLDVGFSSGAAGFGAVAQPHSAAASKSAAARVAVAPRRPI